MRASAQPDSHAQSTQKRRQTHRVLNELIEWQDNGGLKRLSRNSACRAAASAAVKPLVTLVPSAAATSSASRRHASVEPGEAILVPAPMSDVDLMSLHPSVAQSQPWRICARPDRLMGVVISAL